jgi:hypothetical protein
VAKNNKIIFEVIATAKGLKVVTKDAEKLTKNTDAADRSTKKLRKSRDSYMRTEKGVAGISSNSTKNFSKMQQSMDGGGGGGLVRTYALLAANVFALTAAFGVLSRSAQVDTLTTSIERLEIISGKSIKQVGRDLQEASGFSLDFANSLRSTSLALSAGFNSEQIIKLGEVAKNASVSLGRNLADSLDRIFRGVIKVEPELLDEIGLFIRVDEAASKYADSLGIAQSELTEFQKRQAFLNESIDQGTRKFSAFSDVDPDAFATLAATFSDLAQGAVSFINKGLTPIINYFQANKALLAGAFGAIAVSLLRQVIPAMGVFRQNARAAAIEATAAFSGFQEELKSTGEASKKANLDMANLGLKNSKKELKATQAVRARLPLYKQGGKALEDANKQLDKAVTKEEKVKALRQKSAAFEKSRKSTNSEIITAQQVALNNEADALDNVIAKEKTRNNIKARKVQAVQPQAGTFMNLEQMRLAKVELRAVALENISTTASTVGLKAALMQIETELYQMGLAATAAGSSLGFFEKMSFRLTASLTALSIKMSELMMRIAPFMPLIMIGVAVMPMLTKAMGFGGEAAKKYGDTMDKTNELLETFDDKLENVTATIANSESSFEALSEANTAFNNAIVETSKSLIEQKEAYNLYLASTNGFVRFFTDFAGSGNLDIVKNEIQAVSDVLANFESATPEVQDLIRLNIDESVIDSAVEMSEKIVASNKLVTKERNEQLRITALIKAGQLTIIDASGKEVLNSTALVEVKGRVKDAIKESNKLEEEQGKLLLKNKSLSGGMAVFLEANAELSERQAAAQVNAKSAIDGAKDSAREFAKKFITKTDVDKPLSSFRQITAALALQKEGQKEINLSTQDRTLLLQSIINGENAVFDIMSEEGKLAIKNAKTDKERLKILEDEETAYANIRIQQLSSKAVLKEIKDLQKAIKGLTKETAVGVQKTFALRKEEQEIQIALVQSTLLTQRNAANLSEEQVKYLAGKKIDAALTDEIAGMTSKNGEAMTVILTMRKLDNMLLQQQLDMATELDRKQIKIQGILKKRITGQEKLNKAILEGQKLNAQINSALTTGSTNLSETAKQKLLIAGEEMRLKTAKRKAEIEKSIIKAQFAIIKAELKILNDKAAFAGITGFDYQDTVAGLDEALSNSISLIDKGLENASANFVVDLLKGVEGGFGNVSTDIAFEESKSLTKFLDKISLGGTTLAKLRTNKETAKGEIKELTSFITKESKKNLKDQDILGIAAADEQIGSLQSKIASFDTATMVTAVSMLTAAFQNFAEQVAKLGPDGELAGVLAQFSGALLTSVTAMAATFQSTGGAAARFAAVMQVVSTVIAGFSSALTADANARVAKVDDAIAAEKRLDGTSQASLSKIKTMEAKKEAIAKKTFETNKKLQIANAIVSAAAGAAMALAYAGPFGPVLAGMILALGMAQVALIRKTSYQGGSSDVAAPNTALSIGGRSNAVDVSQGASAGETAYLRGNSGSGSNANNFTPGGAMGRKGYADGGMLVGERGPEVVTKEEIIPNYALGAGGTTSVTFNVNAMDGQSVQNMLFDQQGNIIQMIRDAANDNGETFLETVDTPVYNGTDG